MEGKLNSAISDVSGRKWHHLIDRPSSKGAYWPITYSNKVKGEPRLSNTTTSLSTGYLRLLWIPFMILSKWAIISHLNEFSKISNLKPWFKHRWMDFGTVWHVYCQNCEPIIKSFVKRGIATNSWFPFLTHWSLEESIWFWVHGNNNQHKEHLGIYNFLSSDNPLIINHPGSIRHLRLFSWVLGKFFLHQDGISLFIFRSRVLCFTI